MSKERLVTAAINKSGNIIKNRKTAKTREQDLEAKQQHGYLKVTDWQYCAREDVDMNSKRTFLERN